MDNHTLAMFLCQWKGASDTAVKNLFPYSKGAGRVAVIDKMTTAVGVWASICKAGTYDYCFLPSVRFAVVPGHDLVDSEDTKTYQCPVRHKLVNLQST